MLWDKGETIWLFHTKDLKDAIFFGTCKTQKCLIKRCSYTTDKYDTKYYILPCVCLGCKLKCLKPKYKYVLFLGLTLKYNKEDNKPVSVPSDLYRKGCVEDVDEGLKSANKIGFPVMIKASEGGGGKGIRKAENADDFPNLFRQVHNGTKQEVFICSF